MDMVDLVEKGELKMVAALPQQEADGAGTAFSHFPSSFIFVHHFALPFLVYFCSPLAGCFLHCITKLIKLINPSLLSIDQP
jgi:hypothetical protein